MWENKTDKVNEIIEIGVVKLDENLDKDDACDPWKCAEGEKDCSTTFCDDKNKIEQKVECSDPVQYNIDNPPVEEDSSTEGETSDANATDENSTTDAV